MDLARADRLRAIALQKINRGKQDWDCRRRPPPQARAGTRHRACAPGLALCRHTDRDRVVRHVRQDHRAGADDGILPDPDVADDGCVRADERAGADLGMTIAAMPPVPAERDAMKQRGFVADFGGFADDDSAGVVEHHGRADLRGRMDVDAQQTGTCVRQQQRRALTPGAPVMVRDPIRLERMKALGEEEYGAQAIRGGIALHGRPHVRHREAAQFGVIPIGLLDHRQQLRRACPRTRQLIGKQNGQGALKPRLIQKPIHHAL